MYKRAIGLSLVIAIILMLVLLLRRRPSVAQQQMTFAPSPYVPDPLPKEMIDPEIEAALETSPGVHEADLAERAFVAGAVGIELTPRPSVAPQQNAPPAAVDQAGAADQAISGYCVRCRTKQVMSEVRLEQASDGRRMARGTCSVCGAKMARFLKQTEQGNQHAKRS